MWESGGNPMTDRELRKLGRRDLLEILIAQRKEIESLQQRLDEAEGKLKDRQIRIDRAGSLAEAVMELNGVLEAAQAAADQYLENIRIRAGEELPDIPETGMPEPEPENSRAVPEDSGIVPEFEDGVAVPDQEKDQAET